MEQQQPNLSRGIRLFKRMPWATGITIILVAVMAYSAIRLTEGTEPSRYAPQQWVDLSSESSGAGRPQNAGPDNTLLRIAVAPVISPKKNLMLYQKLVDYLGNALGKKAIIVQRQNYTDINEIMRYRLCDLAIVCTYPFLRGEEEGTMELLVVPEVKSGIHYHSLFLVSATSEVQSLLDLRGGSFASSSNTSFTGWYYPMEWLRRQGENPKTFFGKHVITGGHDLSIEAVASGYVDVAAVHSLVYHYMLDQDPGLAAKVRILHQSPALAMPPIVIHPDTELLWKKRLQEALLAMHTTPEGREVLLALSIKRFVLPDPAAYQATRKIMEEWRKQ